MTDENDGGYEFAGFDGAAARMLELGQRISFPAPRSRGKIVSLPPQAHRTPVRPQKADKRVRLRRSIPAGTPDEAIEDVSVVMRTLHQGMNILLDDGDPCRMIRFQNLIRSLNNS